MTRPTIASPGTAVGGPAWPHAFQWRRFEKRDLVEASMETLNVFLAVGMMRMSVMSIA